MSNNKQTIKLYTEEQVKKVIKDSFLEGIERNTNYESVKKSIFNSLTPIELPSDDEIRQEAEKYAISETPDLDTDYARNIFEGQKDGFEQGLKFMRDKIQGISNNTIDEKYNYVTSNEKTLPLLKKIYGDCATDKTATFQVLKKKTQGGNK